MKRVALKRGTKTLKRSCFKRKTTPTGRVLPKKKLGSSGAKNKRVGGKKKLPSIKTMRNKCDKLLTPIIKLMFPYCIFTGEPTEVAHHAIKKSTSSSLRYYLPNLIPLTHKAHMRLHADEILWTGKLIEIKGMDWWKDLMSKKETYTKCDVHFYIEQYERLSYIQEKLQSEKPVV